MFDSMNADHVAFINAQKLFFTASSAGGRDANVSPKGIFPLKILGPNEVAVLDLFGSGNRTAEDIAEGGRVTLMFCSFDEEPLILRLFCYGEAIRPDDARFEKFLSNWSGTKMDGVRQIFSYKVTMVQTSCGYGVPKFRYEGEKKFASKLLR